MLLTTVNILRQAGATLLNAVPAHIDYDKVMIELQGIKGASAIHDLHIWPISTNTVRELMLMLRREALPC